jgi:hypothetical protein
MTTIKRRLKGHTSRLRAKGKSETRGGRNQCKVKRTYREPKAKPEKGEGKTNGKSKDTKEIKGRRQTKIKGRDKNTEKFKKFKFY